MLELVRPEERAELARYIAALWHSAYDGLLGAAQVDYMTEKFQSESAIAEQIRSDNYIYFFIVREGAEVAGAARRMGLRAVYLTVNKGNARAVRAYEKFGFIRTDGTVTDIGGGYVMDDYVYEYAV